MKTSEFCYWLQGFFELSESKTLSEAQTQVVKNHLNLVFIHDLDPKQIKDKLQQVHDAELAEPSTIEIVFKS